MPEVTADAVAAARGAVETIARRTPVLSTRTISERAGGGTKLSLVFSLSQEPDLA